MVDIFFDALKAQYHIDLNDQQKAAVRHGPGPALVLAGPGSGKTTVIMVRTAWLILNQRVCPDNILTVTFNKAAQLEMKNRFNRFFGGDVLQKPHFSTLHSFCLSVIKDYERRQGKRLRLIEGETGAEGTAALNKQKILKELYREINGSNIHDDELETLINDIGFVRNRMIRDFEGFNFQTKNFQNLYKAYNDYKKQNYLMDFDDMLSYCYSVLRHCPDILDRYKSRYTYFQVDEGQDLSIVQFEILKLLVASKDNNLFIVADDDQSIYSFRGAEPGYILGFDNQYSGVKVYKLEYNYRSGRDIVETSSQFIKNNHKRYDKNHRTGNPQKYPPEIVRVPDEEKQLSFITKKIKELQKREKEIQIAVLYRNNLSSVALADRLDREGIAFKIRQNRLYFFQHWLVLDILAFLKFSLDPFDMESFLRICFKMNRYISKSMMENSINYGNTAGNTAGPGSRLPVIERILKSNELEPYQYAKLHGLVKEFKRLSGMRPYRALQYVDEDFKYFGYVRDYCNYTGLSIDYLYGLFGILKTLSLPCRTDQAFLERLEELNEKFEGASSFGGEQTAHDGNLPPVTLTTLHSSKGLEFDVVFMIDLTNAEIPGEKALGRLNKDGDVSLVEEERRVFYVGMTRARTRLYLVSPESVNDIQVPRSTFVNEVAAILNGKMTDQIKEGAFIIHKKYGRGVIASVETRSGRTVIEVDFSGLIRKLDLEVCLENRIISFQ